VHFTESQFGLKLHRPICHWIDRLVGESKAWVCSPPDHPVLFQARHEETVWEMVVDRDRLPECQCNETSGTGLPCCHLIALFAQMGSGAFPIQLIAPRWIPDFDRSVLPPLPDLSLHDSDALHRILSEVSSDEEDGSMPAPEDVPDEVEPIEAGRDSSTRKYNRVLAIGKEIAQRASGNAERYDEVLRGMEEIRDSLTFVADGEIRDAAGTPKGRRRGRGHSRPDPDGPTHCALCESDTHNLPDCRYRKTFEKAQKRFVPPTGGKQKCSLCAFRGHRASTCPVIKMAREMLRETGCAPDRLIRLNNRRGAMGDKNHPGDS
jgi:hypothetical protein